jgi:hypothetical protein
VNPGIHRGHTCDGCPDPPQAWAVLAARTAPHDGEPVITRLTESSRASAIMTQLP